MAQAHGQWGLAPLGHEPWALSHEPSSMHQTSGIKHQAIWLVGIGAPNNPKTREVQLATGGRQVAATFPLTDAQ